MLENASIKGGRLIDSSVTFLSFKILTGRLPFVYNNVDWSKFQVLQITAGLR